MDLEVSELGCCGVNDTIQSCTSAAETTLIRPVTIFNAFTAYAL